MTTRETRLAEFKKTLGVILTDLTNMPASKIGSQWHADRCDEARYLCERIEILSADVARESKMEAMWREATTGIADIEQSMMDDAIAAEMASDWQSVV